MREEGISKKVALVTGATGAIGKAIARGIGARTGYTVVVVGRDEGKVGRTVEQLRRETGNPEIRGEVVDLSRYAEIAALRRRWQGPLHVLVNNAAATPRKRMETPEGIEVQFATNVLGYFWMTLLFEDVLKASAPARVVNVASYWAGGLDLDDLEFKRRRYDNDAAYRQSKQANRMLTAAFSERLAPFGVTVNVCHPGDVNSKLSNDLGFGGHETPEQGARTPVWLATDSMGGEVSGRYFEHLREVPCRFMQDHAAVHTLFERCLAYTPERK